MKTKKSERNIFLHSNGIEHTAVSLLTMVEMKLRSNFWVDFNVKFDI